MALPDDGRLDLADLVTIGNAVSAMASPALKEAVIGFNLVHSETCPDTTNVIKFAKDGYCVAEAVVEGAVYTPSDANSDPAMSSVTCTAVKYMVATPVSHEAIRFGAGHADFGNIARKHGLALGRAFDDDLLGLFDSITAAATATSTLDVDTLLTAQYNIFNGNVPPGVLAAVLDYKGMMEIKKVIANSGAAQYANSDQIAILRGAPQANNFVANFMGIDFYQTTGLSTTGTDDQGCLFDPRFAFCTALGGQIYSEVVFTGYGVASQIPGVSYAVISWMYWDTAIWNNEAASEVRSDT